MEKGRPLRTYLKSIKNDLITSGQQYQDYTDVYENTDDWGENEREQVPDISIKTNLIKNKKGSQNYLCFKHSTKAEPIQHHRKYAIRVNDYTDVQRKRGTNKILVLFGTVVK